MFVFFLDVKHDDASDLHLRQQVLITKDEKDLTVLLILLSQQIVLHNCQIIQIVFITIVQHLVSIAFFLGRLQTLRLEVPVPQREHIPIDLYDVHGEVDVGKIEVNQFKLRFLLLNCCLLMISAMHRGIMAAASILPKLNFVAKIHSNIYI